MFAAYSFDLRLTIDYGDNLAHPYEDFFMPGPDLYHHFYSWEGNYTLCVYVENKVSHDEACWQVEALNPVVDYYDIDFGEINIGCGCGATPYLGNGDGIFPGP